MATKQEVAKVEEAKLPVDADLMNDMMADAGAGMENLTSRDLAIPFIQIIQSNSPQVTRGKAEFNADAKSGMFLNSATQQFYDGEAGIILVPAAYQLQAAEWTPRNKGGGLVRNFGTDVAAAEALITGKDPQNGHDITANGTEIVIAGTHYVLVVNEETGAFFQAVVSLASTQSKKSRRWNSLMSSLQLPKPGGGVFTPPSFGMSYLAKTTPESNDKGSWMGWVISQHKLTLQLPNGKEIYEAAKKFKESVVKGEVSSAAVGGETDDTAGKDMDKPAF